MRARHETRAAPAGAAQLSLALKDLGFELDDVSPEGVGHRFRRGADMIDVLAPDGGGKPRITADSQLIP